jgi:hypothetical protein
MSQSAPTDIDIGRFYTPQPVQRKFHASEARYLLHEGGRGGGKSTALLWEAISQCMLVPGAKWLLLRRTLTAMEKRGIEDLFKKQVPRFAVPQLQRHQARHHVLRRSPFLLVLRVSTQCGSGLLTSPLTILTTFSN